MKKSFLFLFLFLITVIPFHANADLLNSAVRIKAQIPEKARTSKFLGKEREGSGIVIDDEGHVLTIGYLVLEAGSVEITDVDGRVIAAAVEGYDGDSGFGLLKALSPLQARPLRLSDSSDIQSEEVEGGQQPGRYRRSAGRCFGTGNFRRLLGIPFGKRNLHRTRGQCICRCRIGQ